MEIRRFAPPPQLAKFVKCYYYLENTEDRVISDTFFADGCIEVVFSSGWEFHKDGQLEDWAKIIGQIFAPRKLRIEGRGKSFGIWFYPQAFSYFSDIPMFELNDSVLSWDDLFPSSFAGFIGNSINDGELDKLVAGVNEFLLTRLGMYRCTRMDGILDSAIDYLTRHGGNSDLDKLAILLNVSHRYLQKAFLTRVGFSQKCFIRITRFQATLRSMNQGRMSTLTGIAHANDFFDQSHFNREFKAFTGFKPSEFKAVELPINQHFLAGE